MKTRATNTCICCRSLHRLDWVNGKKLLRTIPAPDGNWTYAGILYNFAKGMAYTHEGMLRRSSSWQHFGKKNPIILKVRDYPFTRRMKARWSWAYIKRPYFSQKRNMKLRSVKYKKQLVWKTRWSMENPWLDASARQYLGAFLCKWTNQTGWKDIPWGPAI